MKLKGLFLTAGLSAAVLAACGGNTEADAGAANENSEINGLSGNLTVYLPSPAGLADNLIAAFEAKTGVTVEQFQGTTGQILARIEAESANPIADVVILASWSDGMELREQGLLHSFTPELASKLDPSFVSEDNTMFGTSASAVGVAYNTTLIDSLDADWSELAGSEFADQLVFPDPELSGSAKDFLAGFMYNNQENGWSTWEALAANGMTVPGANAAALESVVTGERAILVAGVDWNVYSAINSGEPLAFYYPAGGTVINPRPAMVMESSQNMEAAEAFVNFLMSDEAQQMVIDAFLIPGRSDINSDLRPNVDEINVLDADWDWMMNNATEINSTFNNLFR